MIAENPTGWLSSLRGGMSASQIPPQPDRLGPKYDTGATSHARANASGTIRTSDPQIRSRLEQIPNTLFKTLFLLAFVRIPLRRLNFIVAFGACRRPGASEDDDDAHPPRDISATSRFRRPRGSLRKDVASSVL